MATIIYISHVLTLFKIMEFNHSAQVFSTNGLILDVSVSTWRFWL